MHCLTVAGPRSAPTATPAKVQPRGRAGRVDDAARLECRATNPATYMSSPGPKARRRGRVVPRSVRDGRRGRDPSAPPAGGGGVSAGPQVALPWPAEVRVPDLAGAGGQSATRRGHLGHGPKGHALAELAEESGAIPQRGAVVATGPLHSSQRLGGTSLRIQVEAAVRQPGRGPF